MQLLSNAVRSLPSYAIKDVLSVGICVASFGYSNRTAYVLLFFIFTVSSAFSSRKTNVFGGRSCAGILQHLFSLIAIQNVIRSSFSVAQVILENECAILLDMKWKYGSEQWFPEKSVSERISLKDAQKLAVVKPLEAFSIVLQDFKSSMISF
ncbi:hypothetical protein SLA2020_462030 [Shorea laevis]